MRAYCYTIVTYYTCFKLFIHKLTYLSKYLFINLFVYSSVCLCIYLFIITPHINLFNQLLWALPNSSFIYLFVYSYIMLFFHELIRLDIWMPSVYSNHSLLIIDYCLSYLHYISCLVLLYLNKQTSVHTATAANQWVRLSDS